MSKRKVLTTDSDTEHEGCFLGNCVSTKLGLASMIKMYDYRDGGKYFIMVSLLLIQISGGGA